MTATIHPRSEPLRRWLAFLGADCTCEYAWKGLGVLYGVSMGKGWVLGSRRRSSLSSGGLPRALRAITAQSRIGL